MPSAEGGGCWQHAAIRPEDTGRNRPVVLSALKRRPAAILRIVVPLASESGPVRFDPHRKIRSVGRQPLLVPVLMHPTLLPRLFHHDGWVLAGNDAGRTKKVRARRGSLKRAAPPLRAVAGRRKPVRSTASLEREPQADFSTIFQ